MFFPEPGREQPDVFGRMRIDALQDIDQIVEGMDPVQAAGRDQALQDADVMGADLGPAEHPVSAPQCDGADGALEMVGIDCDRGIGKIHAELGPALEGVAEGFGQRVARQQPLIGERVLAPAEKRLDDRL